MDMKYEEHINLKKNGYLMQKCGEGWRRGGGAAGKEAVDRVVV